MGIDLNKIKGRLTKSDIKFLYYKWEYFVSCKSDETYSDLVVAFQKIAFRNFRHQLCELLDDANDSAIVMNLNLPFPSNSQLEYDSNNSIEDVESILEMFQRVTIDSARKLVIDTFNDQQITNTLLSETDNLLNDNKLIVPTQFKYYMHNFE